IAADELSILSLGAVLAVAQPASNHKGAERSSFLWNIWAFSGLVLNPPRPTAPFGPSGRLHQSRALASSRPPWRAPAHSFLTNKTQHKPNQNNNTDRRGAGSLTGRRGC